VFSRKARTVVDGLVFVPPASMISTIKSVQWLAEIP